MYKCGLLLEKLHTHMIDHIYVCIHVVVCMPKNLESRAQPHSVVDIYMYAYTQIHKF